jgi:sterol desaturase/sphingolipid hydroxylase (fatty acid hydroxylase superfamily)
MGINERAARFRCFWFFPLVSVLLIFFSFKSDSQATWFRLAGFAFAGVAFWTLLEYVFHRFLLHAEFHNPKLGAFLNGSHLLHHAAPRDRDQILVKLPFALVTSSIIYAILLVITRDFFVVSGIISGVWLGFLYYEAVHYRVHMSLAHSPLLQQQRRAHFYHHFSNSGKCFGVTSPLWDYVFGTMRRDVRQAS